MSKEGDARDCLIGALAAVNNVVLDPADLNTVTPQDTGLNHDVVSWRKVLEKAGDCLTQKGHDVTTPTNADSQKVLTKTMVHSVRLLARMIGSALSKASVAK